MNRLLCWWMVWTLLGAGVRVVAGPIGAPPAVHGHRESTRHPIRPAAVQLQYTIGDPTDEEQLFLEYINRARANPTLEGQRLAASTSLLIRTAFKEYQVDLAKLQIDLATNPPTPPLAFESHLMTTARSHTQWMLDHAYQAHEETNPTGDLDHIVNTTFDRIVAAGYDYANAGENVFAYSDTVEYGHAGFEVDWGVGPGGVQAELGHRLNNHDPNVTEVGIGILRGLHSAPVLTQISGTNAVVTNTVGPQVITVDFGSRFDQPALVTGVAHFDFNGNQFYDVGEGLSGVRVDIDSSSTFAVTSNSGGYAIPAAEGTQIVTFSGPGLSPIQKSVTITQGKNVKLDLRLPYTAPVVTAPATVYSGVPNGFTCDVVPLATTYDFETGSLSPYTAVIDPKNGLGPFQPQVTTNAGAPAYSLILGDFFTSTLGFHLASASLDPQRLVLGARLRVGSNSKLSFGSELGVAGTNQYARVEISTDGGDSWTKLWEQKGRAVNNSTTIEPSFTTRTISLASYAGWECLFRFSYVVELDSTGTGSFQTGLGRESGFFFNAVSFTGVDLMTPAPTNSVPSNRAALTPSGLGNQYFRVHPKAGTRSLPAGPLLAATVVAPPAIVHLTTPVVGSGAVDLFPPGGVYAKGTVVTVTPKPADHWGFKGWSGGATGAANPLTLTVTTDTTVTATFTANTVTLSTPVIGNGTVAVSPPAGPYLDGSVVTLTATPSAGWVFTGWSGSASGSANPLVLPLSGNTTVTANFTQAQVTLSTVVSGNGALAVSPPSGPYASGTLVTLTATPSVGWVFAGWSGGAQGTNNPLSVTLLTNITVTANFTLAPVHLTTSVVGSGTVARSPDAGSYAPGTVVNLTAVPAAGFKFSGWSGAASGVANPLPFTLNSDSTVTATFVVATPPVVGIQGLVLRGDGTLRLDFSLAVGTATQLSLETAPSLGGVWSGLAVPLTTNSPGVYSFQPITPSGSGAFFRVRAE